MFPTKAKSSHTKKLTTLQKIKQCMSTVCLPHLTVARNLASQEKGHIIEETFTQS